MSNIKKKSEIIIACGGTGGHIAPGIALGEHFHEKFTDINITFLLADKKIARNFIDKIPAEANYILIPEIYFRKISAFFHNIRSIIKIFSIIFTLNKKEIKSIFSTGSGSGIIPVVFFKIFGVPVYLLEQNAIMGKANKFLSIFAKKIFLTLPVKEKNKDDKKLIVGSPLPQYATKKIADKNEIYKELGLRSDLPVLLVMGGSQGARSLNLIVIKLVKKLLSNNIKFQVVHLTGKFSEHEISKLYKDINLKCCLKSHYQEMYKLYNIADIAISRAGAGSLCELSYWGIPALLFPYPHAAEDHQFFNGDYFMKREAAILTREEDLDINKAVEWIEDGLLNQETMSRRKKAMMDCLPKNAAELIINKVTL